MTDQTTLDKLRSDLFQDTANSPKSSARPPTSSPYASKPGSVSSISSATPGIGGRSRFLDAMKLPGVDADRRRNFDDLPTRSGAKDRDTCQAEIEGDPALSRPLRRLPDQPHTPKTWWAAPISQLIADYDPDNPPADELRGWEHQLRQTHGKAGAELLLGIGAAFEAAEAVHPGRRTTPSSTAPPKPSTPPPRRTLPVAQGRPRPHRSHPRRRARLPHHP
jgi:hypothetical protein